MTRSIRARLLLMSLGLIAVSAAAAYPFFEARWLAVAVLTAGLFALVFSAAAGWLWSRALRSVTATLQRMADGDLGARVGSPTVVELGELSAALDRMAQNLSRATAQQRAQLDRLGGILSGMEEGVLVLDDEGRVAMLNPPLREMLLLPSDSIGKTPIEVIRHADLKELLDEARQQGPVTREIELGELQPRLLRVRAARAQAHRHAVFAVFVDVTERRRLETVRRDFVANVSHELRTPVTAIRSAAETLSNAIENDPLAASAFVEIIDRNAQRLHGLVEDLLDLSRIESREHRLDLEPIDLALVFPQVLSLFGDRAAKRQVTLLNELGPGVPPVRADRRALEHVLTNLVDNAVKYSGAGSEVRLDATLEGSMLRVAVADNGSGIAEEHLPRIFERFYRVDTGRSRSLGGTGLGLGIVRHLVEAMGGNVSVSSQVGEGTTFCFTVPRA